MNDKDIEIERLHKKISDLQDDMIRHFNEEHLKGDGPEIDRWKRKVKGLEESLFTISALGLQSDRYYKDMDFRDAIDDGLLLTKDRLKK